MCFNLLFPFKDQPATHPAFLKLLGIDGSETISNFEFEKVFEQEAWHNGGTENTNFDSYIKLASGTELFFELKYSEQGFSTLPADMRHRGKLMKIYAPRLATMLRPDFLAEKEFFRHYQLFRNIAYLCDDHDTRLFLIFPRSNFSFHDTQQALDEAVLPAVRAKISILHLEDLIDLILAPTNRWEPLFWEHYRLFKEKYLPECITHCHGGRLGNSLTAD